MKSGALGTQTPNTLKFNLNIFLLAKLLYRSLLMKLIVNMVLYSCLNNKYIIYNLILWSIINLIINYLSSKLNKS